MEWEGCVSVWSRPLSRSPSPPGCFAVCGWPAGAQSNTAARWLRQFVNTNTQEALTSATRNPLCSPHTHTHVPLCQLIDQKDSWFCFSSHPNGPPCPPYTTPSLSSQSAPSHVLTDWLTHLLWPRLCYNLICIDFLMLIPSIYCQCIVLLIGMSPSGKLKRSMVVCPWLIRSWNSISMPGILLPNWFILRNLG